MSRVANKQNQPRLEICILSGGLSQRMGRDKARLRLGGRSMLKIIKATARSTGLPVRVIRRDLVPRCGPIGGILTAFKTSSARWQLFLACDMPFLTAELLARLAARPGNRAVFVRHEKGVGFPFLLPRSSQRAVENQIARREFSLQNLALSLKAQAIRVPRLWSYQLENVNTPTKLAEARRQWRRITPAT